MLFHVLNYRRGHSLITLAHKALYLNPPPLLFTLVLVAPSPSLSNNQNLTSTPPSHHYLGDGTILKKGGIGKRGEGDNAPFQTMVTQLQPKNILHCTYEALKNITQFCDCKTVMELCNEISQTWVIKITSKKQLFFKVKLGSKHDNSLKNCQKNIYDIWSQFFLPTTSTEVSK